MEPTDHSPPTAVLCPSCGVALTGNVRFCPNCGAAAEERHDQGDAIKKLTPTFAYYFLTLFLLAVYQFSSVFDASFKSMVIITGIDVLLVISFWINFRRSFTGLFSLRKIRAPILALVLAGSVAGAFVVSFVADMINLAINDDVFYNYFIFMETPYPELMAILFVCVQPAIFEEVAFRGFLYSNIEPLAGPASTVYITAFLFGIMHLAFISLIWLVPIGWAFAYLRMRYNTLWYGMAGHFVYNFTIMAIEYVSLN